MFLYTNLKHILTTIPFLTSIKKGLMPFFLKIIGIFFGFLMAFIISKRYGAQGWGIFSLITTASMFCVYLGKLGFDTALLKFTASFEVSSQRASNAFLYKKILFIIVPLSALLTVSIFFYSQFIAQHFFHKPYLYHYIQLGALLIFPNILILIHSEGLRGMKQINKYSLLQNCGLYLSFIILYFLAHHFVKLNNTSPLTIYTVGSYIVLLLSLLWWIPNLSFSKIKSKTHDLYFKDFIKVALPMFWSNAMIVIIGWTDTIMLGLFDKDVEVGIFNVALKISNLVMMPLMTANSVLAPYYAEMAAKHNHTGLYNLVSKSSKFIALSSIPIFLVILLFPETVMSLFGKEYSEGKYILIILATGQFFNTLCGTTDSLLQMTGYEKAFRNIIGIGTILNVVLNYFLIPTYGYYGAAWTSFISIITWNILGLVFIKRKLKISMLYNPFRNLS